MSKITFLPEVDSVSESQLFIVEEKLKKLEPRLVENLPKYLDFLYNEQNTLGGIELHWPFFDLGITLMLSMIGKKLQISVLDHKNSKIHK